MRRHSSNDETNSLRRELAELGVDQPQQPENFELNFRAVDSFFEVKPVIAERRTRRWLRPVLALGLAAAVVTASALVPRAFGPTSPITPEIVPVAQVLLAAGEASAEQPDNSRDAAYWRVESLHQQGNDAPIERTIWLGHRTPGVLIDDGVETPLPVATFGLQQTRLSWEELVSLPTDPVALRQLLEQEVDGLLDPTWQMAKLAGELLAETPATPALRQGLWKVVAAIPGVTSEGEVRDALGRDGVQILLTSDTRGELEYIIDPDAGTILQATVNPSDKAKQDFRITYLSRGPVPSQGFGRKSAS